MAKHISDSWIVQSINYEGDGIFVATVVTESSFLSLDTLKSNRHIIEAAPDMLAALEGLVGTTLCRQGVCKEGCEAAYAAIAKAKGVTPCNGTNETPAPMPCVRSSLRLRRSIWDDSFALGGYNDDGSQMG